MTDPKETQGLNESPGATIAPASQGPVINLARIRRIDTYEVMGQDLERLDDAFSREAQALAFMTACAGVFVTAFLSILVATAPSELVAVVHVAVIVLFGIATLWFFVTWRRERKVRPKLIETIKATNIVASTTVVASSAVINERP